MSRFDAVLFDNGQTLFHRTSPIDSIVELTRRHGHAVSTTSARDAWASVKAAKRSGPEHRRRRNASREAHRAYYIDQYAPLETLAPGLAEIFYADHKTSPETMVPYPDTPGVLRALHDHGLGIGIISNTGWDISRGYARAGLLELIDTWVLSWEHGTAKPDPQLFRIGCERLGVAPERALMVGNDGEADSGAVAVGATALILPAVAHGQPRGLDAVLDLVGIRDHIPGEPALSPSRRSPRRPERSAERC